MRYYVEQSHSSHQPEGNKGDRITSATLQDHSRTHRMKLFPRNSLQLTGLCYLCQQPRSDIVSGFSQSSSKFRCQVARHPAPYSNEVETSMDGQSHSPKELILLWSAPSIETAKGASCRRSSEAASAKPQVANPHATTYLFCLNCPHGWVSHSGPLVVVHYCG